MTPIDRIFQRAVSKLLAEVFDGPHAGEAYVLNPGDPGLHRQLEGISAAKASQQSISGKPSIAAHVDHLHFGLSLLSRWLSGEENPWADADWDASWKRSAVTEEQWRLLCSDLRKKADVWQEVVAHRTEWDDVQAAGALSTIAHTA